MIRLRRKLNNKGKRAIQLIAHSNPKLPISEQYRLIRTNILFSAVDKKLKTIMITSPEPAEGKSTTAVNLAIVLAQQGKSVLLVDTDLRKPSIHYAFHISNQYGLTSVLTKRITINIAVSETYVPHLHVLTSGPIPPNPSELLNSKAMETLIQELQDQFEYVVFDTPPVLAVTDAQVLANKCDGVVIVVASGKTQKETALKAKELLERTKSSLLGVIINGIESSNSEYYRAYH